MADQQHHIEFFIASLLEHPQARSQDWEEAQGVAEGWMLPILQSWQNLAGSHQGLKDLSVPLDSVLTDFREAINTMSPIYLSVLQQKKLKLWLHALWHQSGELYATSVLSPSMTTTSTSYIAAPIQHEAAGAHFSSPSTQGRTLREQMRLAASCTPKNTATGTMSW